ncbi:hypothetical protein BH18ACT5_BH18ACT5_01940 [soil metagenome]
MVISGVGGLAALVMHWRKTPIGRTFWTIIALAVAALLFQVLLGLGAMNLEEKDPGNQHVFYGVVISFTLAFAYIYRTQFRKKPGLYYGLLLLFLMGLGIRGIMAFGGNF